MTIAGTGQMLPLIAHSSGDAIFAHCDGQIITAARFLSDVRSVAARLGACPYVINRCADRYRFAVGFAAAMLRGQTTLLPPNDTRELLKHLSAQYREVYCLIDTPSADPVMEEIAFPLERTVTDTGYSVPYFSGDTIAALIFTSGSTGIPSPHIKRWGVLVNSALRAGHRLGVAALGKPAVLATVAPQHSYGLESTIMLPFQFGLPMTAAQPFYPADIVHHLGALPRPRILVTTPIHLRFLKAEGGDVPSADLLVSATAPLPADMAMDAENRFHAPLIEIYGCAEAGQIALRRTSAEAEWALLDGIALTEDETGVWASGDLVERKTLLSDVIGLRENGRFVLQGRTADLVNIGGKRTSLGYLNAQLNAIEGVTDGVFFIPQEEDCDGSGRLAAFVVAPGHREKSVKEALRARIDAVFLPRPLFLLDRLPRNSTGKLPRAELLRIMDEAKAKPRTEGEGEILFEPDCAAAEGHFPGDPIIPGAVLLQEVLFALQDHIDGLSDGLLIKSGKFLSPVRPGDRMAIRWAPTGNGDIRFDGFVRDAQVLTGVIGAGAPTS